MVNGYPSVGDVVILKSEPNLKMTVTDYAEGMKLVATFWDENIRDFRTFTARREAFKIVG